MIFDLVRDFTDVLDAMPLTHPRQRILKLLDEAIRRQSHFIADHTTSFFSKYLGSWLVVRLCCRGRSLRNPRWRLGAG